MHVVLEKTDSKQTTFIERAVSATPSGYRVHGFVPSLASSMTERSLPPHNWCCLNKKHDMCMSTRALQELLRSRKHFRTMRVEGAHMALLLV